MADPTDLKVKPATFYDNFNFPDHEHREFPMAIPVVNGKIMPTPYDERNKPHPVVIVESEAELDALRGPEVALVPISPESSAMRVETEDDVRAVLYVQAEQVGATIDKRWSVARIEDTIKKQVQKNNGGADVV